jgi:hypothetical protein
MLVIDHDHDIGKWAVRGLLCTGCNTTLGHAKAKRHPNTARYLMRPWFRERFGLAVEPWLEPPIGFSVRTGRERWIRTEAGWLCVFPRQTRPIHSWKDMMYRSGPHRIEVVDG